MASTINGTSTGNGGLITTGDDSGVLNIQTNETTAITVDASQNVGIGTSSPGTKLQVNGAFRSRTGTNENVTTQSSVFVAGGVLFNAYNDAVSAATPLEFNASSLQFGTGNAERARIDSSGNLLVGTTTAGTTNSLSTTIETSGANNSRITVNHSSAAGSSNGSAYIQFGYGGTTIANITQASTTTVAYNTSSDYRLKENVQPMTGALEKVAALKPCTYTWKPDGAAGQGFIAHELAEVVPDCVTGAKDAVETYTDEEGNEQTRPVYQGIDTSFLVATLTAAIQEQQALITTLTERITALEAK